MKRWQKIVLIVIALLVAIVIALFIWQRNNIMAAAIYLTQDSQKIAENMELKREEHRQAIQEQVPITVAPPSNEQSEAILTGEKTPEQVKQELGITDQLEKTDGVQSAEELINSCVAEMYACKVDLMERLAGLRQDAMEQWWALPAEERTDARKRQIGLDGLKQCYSLEAETDEQIQEILDRYRSALKQMDADTSILDDLWGYYLDEKIIEKAYYMDKYLK